MNGKILRLRIFARRRRPVVVGMLATLLAAGGTQLVPVPARGANGFELASARMLAPGVEYRRLVRSQDPVVAHVVVVKQTASVRLRAVLSNDRVGAPPPISERTSEMCRRVGCIAAVNGDFSVPDKGEPVGGVVHAGRLLRSPAPAHDQLAVSASGGLTAGALRWSGRLVPLDLGPVTVDGLNSQPSANGVILYTPAYGSSTPETSSSTEIVLRSLELPLPPALGQAGLVELVSIHDGTGRIPIPPDGAVLAAQGSGANLLRALWERSKASLLGPRALFQLEMSPPILESIGGSPILLRAGRALEIDGSDLVTSRHPRTLVGWNRAESFLVAVDGRQPGYSVGLTLREAADLLARLGATEGINLDGGGSTTLAIGGTVVNRPSDRLVLRAGREEIVAQPGPNDTVVGPVERPVSDALVVVTTSPLSVLEDLLGPDLLSPPPGLRAPGSGDDPASRASSRALP